MSYVVSAHRTYSQLGDGAVSQAVLYNQTCQFLGGARVAQRMGQYSGTCVEISESVLLELYRVTTINGSHGRGGGERCTRQVGVIHHQLDRRSARTPSRHRGARTHRAVYILPVGHGGGSARIRRAMAGGRR